MLANSLAYVDIVAEDSTNISFLKTAVFQLVGAKHLDLFIIN